MILTDQQSLFRHALLTVHAALINLTETAMRATGEAEGTLAKDKKSDIEASLLLGALDDIFEKRKEENLGGLMTEVYTRYLTMPPNLQQPENLKIAIESAVIDLAKRSRNPKIIQYVKSKGLDVTQIGG